MASMEIMTALLKLPAKLEARNARWERQMQRSAAAWRRRAATRAMQRRLAHTESCQRHHIGLDYAAGLVRVSVQQLGRATKGQPFRFDFGRGEGTLLHVVDLMAWARRQAAAKVKAVAA